MDDNVILEVKNLKTQFYTQDGIVKAVNGISYNLQKGETLGVVGESGCGKSVSMMSLLRLIPEPPGEIISGEALFMGQDLLGISEEALLNIRGKEIAMIFQDSLTGLNPLMTIGRQITEMLEIHKGMDLKTAEKRAIELLELVSIPGAADRINDYPHQFSGGMRQRVMIAMALACTPKILIADEPTTALDVTIQAQLVDLIKSLRDEFDMAIIWITHDLGVVAGLVDRVMVMYAGYIVEDALVDDLYDEPYHPYTLGLLGSVPRIDLVRNERLDSIEGMPPDLISLTKGCPFASRCNYVIERCLSENPPLVKVGVYHHAACWVDVNTGRQR
jgi:oligopeptide transport system ATP-binding protein